MATTVSDVTPIATANGWDDPVSTAILDSTLFQHKFVKDVVVVTVLTHRNGVIADASRVDEATGAFALVGQGALTAQFVQEWLQA